MARNEVNDPSPDECCTECGRADICALCLLMSRGSDIFTNFTPTPEQEAAMDAWMAADEADPALYQAMLDTGLPGWGKDITDAQSR